MPVPWEVSSAALSLAPAARGAHPSQSSFAAPLRPW